MKRIKIIGAIVLTLTLSITGYSQSIEKIITAGSWHLPMDSIINNTIKVPFTINLLQGGLFKFKSDSTIEGYGSRGPDKLIPHPAHSLGQDRLVAPSSWLVMGFWEMSGKDIIIYMNNTKFDCKVAYKSNDRITLVIVKRIQ